jgi:ABC-2 type transport system permease protein
VLDVARRPRPLPVARRAFADHSRSLLGWVVGLTTLVVVQVAVYPTVRDQQGLSDAWRNAPDAVKALFGLGGELDFTTGPGYLRAEIFAFTLPLLFLIYALGAGAGAIAGDEERGTLGLLLAQPVRRSRVVLERCVAMAGSIAMLAGVVFVALVVAARICGLDIGYAQLAAAMAATLLLASLYGAIALAAGCATGRRGAALSTAAGAAVVGFLIDSLAGVTDVVRPLQPLSPFHWANPSQLVLGRAAGGLVWPAVFTLLFVAAGAVLLERRDVTRS